MGLSGRKIKQRIPTDPRNLSWADDAARFGSNYLSKFGWDSSKGLGVGEEGRTSHIKVAQKLDMMGIGAAHQMDANGIAWKQNKDFESLLKRLNGTEGAGVGFVKPKGDVEGKEGEKEKEKKKDRDGGGGEKKKKRKREGDGKGAEKKSKKSKKRGSEDSEPETETPKPAVPEATLPEPVEQKSARVVPRHRSHRARHIAAKSLASKSAAAISEILGIAPTASTASSGTGTPQEGRLTEVGSIRTSSKSLQEYFKERLG